VTPLIFGPPRWRRRDGAKPTFPADPAGDANVNHHEEESSMTKTKTETGMTEAYDWRGRTAIDPEGQKIGEINEIYLDHETGKPEWALVHTGLFGTKSSFVPLAGANPAGEDVQLAFDKNQVKEAPGVEPEGELSQQEEQTLYDHYRLEYSERRSDTGLPEGQRGTAGREPVGRDTSGPTTDDAMTRSEEELRVGTAERERGRARLVKYVETEQVQQTVPVRREKVRLEREPITDENVDAATSGPEISDEEHEVVLHEEEPVVEKRTVPKERVRMEKDTVTDEQTVSEEVRKERIEAEGDDIDR
jgi:uncharacterized protein (TIGR02271 family)